MKKVAALIDFTPTCDVTLSYTEYLGKNLAAEISLVNIAENDAAKAAAIDKLKSYETKLNEKGIKNSPHVEVGSFTATIDTSLQLLGTELAVTGTHGAQGLKQNLFGANILKLAQKISTPLFVVQDGSKLSGEGIKNILFLIGPHSNFESKSKFGVALAKALGSKITFYTIIKSAFNVSDKLNANINYAKELCEKENVSYEHIVEDSLVNSVGYSRQTVKYMEEHTFDLAIMAAEESSENRAFSKSDKENIVLNSLMVPVLCV